MVPGLAIFFCLTLPWLNPFSPGPMIGAMPLLFSWACATGAGLICVGTPRRMQDQPLMGLAASAWLAAALLSAGLGLLQYFGATGPWGVWVNTTPVGEAFANLRQRNQFASLTSIGLAALLWWLTPATAAARLQGDGDRTHLPPDAPQAATLAAAALLGVGNAASASRTGLMQLVLITGLALLWGGRHHPGIRRALLTAVLAYALATLALPWLAGLDPLSSGAWARLRDGDSACASRLTLWGNVLHLIAQKPWLGWGWGELDYAHFITLYPGGRFCDILDNAHNLPLHLAVELGVPAALVVCGGALWAVCRARPWRETAPMRQMAWAVLAVILLHSLLEYPLWYGPFQVAFGLCVWYLWRTRVQAAKAGQAPNHKTFRPLATVSIALVAIILIAFGSYMAWDYHRISQIYLTPAQRSPAYRDHTLAQLQGSVLFKSPVRFAELTTTPLTTDNATRLHALALELLHFSPEPRVIRKLIESAELLGLAEEAGFYRVRYAAAFASDFARQASPVN